MKKLSDYKGEEAFELWADLMEPISEIFRDTEVIRLADGKHGNMEVASLVLKAHKKEALEIFHRIDPDPVDGTNLIGRLLVMLGELAKDPVLGSFFGYAERAMTESASSGSAMENIGDGVK